MLFGMDGLYLTSMWYFNLKAVGGVEVESSLDNESTCWFSARGMK
jgi:hypothetical protein